MMRADITTKVKGHTDGIIHLHFSGVFEYVTQCHDHLASVNCRSADQHNSGGAMSAQLFLAS